MKAKAVHLSRWDHRLGDNPIVRYFMVFDVSLSKGTRGYWCQFDIMSTFLMSEGDAEAQRLVKDRIGSRLLNSIAVGEIDWSGVDLSIEIAGAWDPLAMARYM